MGSSFDSSQLSMWMWSSSSAKSMECMLSVGGGTACVVWANNRFVVTLGWPKWTTPWSIKSWMVCLRAVQQSVSCPNPWWYTHCRSILNWGRTSWGGGLGVRAVNNLASVSFWRVCLKDIPNCENCLCVLKVKKSRGLLSFGPRIRWRRSRSKLCCIAWLRCHRIWNKRPLCALCSVMRQCQCRRHVGLIIRPWRCSWPILHMRW